MWLKAHWRAAAGAFALLIPLWQVMRSILSTWGDIEFVVAKARDAGWMSSVWGFVIDPPSYIIFPLLLIGMLLIWLDVRNRSPRTLLPSDLLTGPSITSDAAKVKVQEIADRMPDSDGRKPDVYSPGGRVFDHYFSIFNEKGGSIGFAIRQDSKKSRPYVWLDQNEKKYGRRSEGRPFGTNEVEQAYRDLVSRQKKGAYIFSQSPVAQNTKWALKS